MLVGPRQQWRNVQTEVALLGKQKRDLSKAVALKRKAGGDASAEMEESKMVSERLEAANAESDRLKTEVEAKLAEVGNFVDPTVPVSNDEVRIAAAAATPRANGSRMLSDAQCHRVFVGGETRPARTGAPP